MDSKLTKPFQIIICGGSAGILCFKLPRGTADFDVLEAYPDLSELKPFIDEIGKKYDLIDNWLNDSANGFKDFLSPTFRNRLIDVPCDCKMLKVTSISRGDYFTMKLASDREQDFIDIKDYKLNSEELMIVAENIECISRHNRGIANKMRLMLKDF
ncbi:MAG: hypothetical protein GF398_00355 [Chitinivibrionales bacterium]|nr:hypothetical protein [Chitinivibrionales bacterium]